MAVRRDIPNVSSFRSLIHWLQLKNYQYEVTFSLYMLTYTEKIVFNSILFILISLLFTAAFFYLPNHLFIIYTRVWYYISGEFVAHSSNGASTLNGAYAFTANKVGDVLGALKTAKEVVTAASGGVSQSVAQKIVTETVVAAGKGEL